ncbi:MAG: hypothetical protein QM535_14380 [Limnohabitans sp.]|nr:hypothetical protein [Limnohabitans sp.]
MNYKNLFLLLILTIFISCKNNKNVSYNNSFTLKFKNNSIKLKITSYDESSEIESSYLVITKGKIYSEALKDSIEIPYSVKNESFSNSEINVFTSFSVDSNQNTNGEVYSYAMFNVSIGGFKTKLYKHNYSDTITDEQIKLFNKYEIISLEYQPSVTIQGTCIELLLKAIMIYDKKGKNIESVYFKNLKKKYNVNIGKEFEIQEYYLPSSDSNQLIKLKIEQID